MPNSPPRSKDLLRVLPPAYGRPSPTTQASLVDLAYPGVAAGAPTAEARSQWRSSSVLRSAQPSRGARSLHGKNYFYPDLPKGLPDQPVRAPGCEPRLAQTSLLEDGTVKTIGVTRRPTLEEDAGKSLHEGLANATGIDPQTAPVRPARLLEIVFRAGYAFGQRRPWRT